MKQIFEFLKKNASNILFVLVLGYLIAQRVPSVVHNFKMEGKRSPALRLSKLNGELTNLEFEKKAVVIFWATWCTPCHIEMARINKAVINGSLRADDIIAISMGEAVDTVAKFVTSENYKFRVYVDEQNAAQSFFDVSATPTFVHLKEGGEVASMHTGISPMTVMRTEDFLREPQDN